MKRLRTTGILTIALLAVAAATAWQMKRHAEAAERATAPQIIVPPEDARHFWTFPQSADALGSGGEFHVYVDAHTHPHAGGSFAKFALGPEGALPEHKHEKTEELAYILSGEGIARIDRDGEPRDMPIRPGYVWYNPPGVWHAVRNTGDAPLVMVFATIPNVDDGLLSFFQRIGVEPGSEPQPLPDEEFERLAAEHDMILRPVAVD